MLDKLVEIEEKYVDLEKRLQDPNVFRILLRTRKAREQKELSKVVKPARNYKAAQKLWRTPAR